MDVSVEIVLDVAVQCPECHEFHDAIRDPEYSTIYTMTCPKTKHMIHISITQKRGE